MQGIKPECYIIHDALNSRDDYLTNDGWLISRSGTKNSPHSQKTIAIKGEVMHTLQETYSAEAICRILLKARA